MKIETYETATLNQDNPSALVIEGEMLQLIDDLGLDGQKQLAKPGDNSIAVGLMPYRLMTMRERKVFETLFPVKTALTSYRDELIPLRVLQVAAHAKEWFKTLMVWHPKTGKVDPILVGHKGSYYDGEPHILARWGDALDTFDNLCKKAKQLLISKLRENLVTSKLEMQRVEALMSASEIDIEHMPMKVELQVSKEPSNF